MRKKAQIRPNNQSLLQNATQCRERVLKKHSKSFSPNSILPLFICFFLSIAKGLRHCRINKHVNYHDLFAMF